MLYRVEPAGFDKRGDGQEQIYSTKAIVEHRSPPLEHGQEIWGQQSTYQRSAHQENRRPRETNILSTVDVNKEF
jgi:hypothetical protein